ncbi:uncharacterized protein LOC110924335 [Helianthus annuus]|uniref:uncharacterized protein LOC110924335 n=1 Tax=Helianthus annuus TaxID=4232 RepID=UPI000B9069EB|nr:uncharacterized protein LOC110924335 [Helianthus annuus]
MGASIRAAESEEHRQHIRDMKEIHALQEKEKRKKKHKRKEMSASERPEVVTEEVQSLNDFVDALIVDPDEASVSKKTTDERSSKVSPVKPTRFSKPPVPPQRVRPFQELYDKLIKDTGPSVAKEICLLKNQVNDTNILREKIKDQRKKNKEMNAYMAKQSKFIRFQQMGIEKLYRMMRNMCEQMKIKPMFSFDEILDFETFIEEETARKEKEAETKKRRLESVEKVTEGDESDEEEVDRDDMPSRFIEWGLEEEVLWDLREHGRLDLLNPDERGIGRDFQRLIAKECNKGFPNHSPQRPRRRVSKTTIVPVTGKGKVTWVINPAKVVTRIKLPEEVVVALKDFKKWFYDSKTGEAVIRSNENVDIRILDPMDVFMFGLSDLTVLNASRINVGARNANLEEAMLFQRPVERAWKIKREMLDLVDKIEKRKETEEKKKEARKKKNHERKKERTPASTTEPTTTSSPPASSTYEATMEDQQISEVVTTQETPAAPIETQAPPETTTNEDNPKEPEKPATENPAETTEE